MSGKSVFQTVVDLAGSPDALPEVSMDGMGLLAKFTMVGSTQIERRIRPAENVELLVVFGGESDSQIKKEGLRKGS